MKCFTFRKFCSDAPDFFSIFNFHTFLILNVQFGQVQYFLKVWKNNFEIQYFFNTFNTA